MKPYLSAALALLTCTLPLQSQAEDAVAVAARKLFAEKQDAVVWVSVVIKISYSTEGSTSLTASKRWKPSAPSSNPAACWSRP
jgi:hypothetical protein